jgi:hypothetical protein
VAPENSVQTGCSKRLSSKAAASEGPEAYPLGYAEALKDARTTLVGFFNILLIFPDPVHNHINDCCHEAV